MDRKVTALKAQQRNHNRINVHLDDAFAFGLSRDVAAWLRVGDVLNDVRITELLQKDEHEKAYQRASLLLSYHPRSEAEIRNRLVQAGYPDEVVSLVIERLTQDGWLGDTGFSHDWIENRSEFRPRSRRLLTMELRHKGVAEDTIQQALMELETGEEELAFQAAERYVHRLERCDWDEFRIRLAGFLSRRGFSAGDIYPVIGRLWTQFHPEGNHQV
jgi:regulatory protein